MSAGISNASTKQTVAFIGLGLMGLPMAGRLLKAGLSVRGADLSTAARSAFQNNGGKAFASAQEAASGADVVITMLPNGAAVKQALFGDGGAASALRPGALVIEMSSSAPLGTIELGAGLKQTGIMLLDAPVSGGVRRAVDGTLAVIVGGDKAVLEQARPLLALLGASIIHVGPLGSGHAMKALNNYVSATGLAAACEALIVGQAFGIAPETVVDVLNASTGRNNSTETKLKPFILSENYAAGFSLALMAKDLRTAAELSEQIGTRVPGIIATAELWSRASAALGETADHTEIHRYLAQGGKKD